ncbi:hypothetical protein [Arachnia propionica]|uniref:hypothetical protein n=1 Tax=Arachnia propionica TaxID=1750 RepID=UPI000F6C9F17|nr:hypothetical protein [Arachnia propionica]VEJ60127.1 Uncharacterised protein [Arachnia propionica]
MTEKDHPNLPTPEEVAAADALARQFLEQISAVPVNERKLLKSDKFADPIAERVVKYKEQSDG